MDYEEIYISNKQHKLSGRYVHLEHIEPILNDLNDKLQLSIVGYSVLSKPIYSYKIGHGKIKILMWSQMHGNESTTTKAIFDFINFIKSDAKLASEYLDNYTFNIIPILNPDGAELYTRENANGIDLNRDFKDLSQLESNILMQVFNDFDPDYCYNMHDQRTIYGTGIDNKPATVSFLAPSFNENCDFNENRTQAAAVIVAINEVLQQFIPEQVGRFDDAHNDNCAGDTFQKLGKPTILFEAGHYPNDYNREKTRKFIFFGLISSFNFIISNTNNVNTIHEYQQIPQNNVCFFDIIFKNVRIIKNNNNINATFAVQFDEIIEESQISFKGVICEIENLENFHGHIEIDGNNELFTICENRHFPEVGDIANFEIGNQSIINGKLSVFQ